MFRQQKKEVASVCKLKKYICAVMILCMINTIFIPYPGECADVQNVIAETVEVQNNADLEVKVIKQSGDTQTEKLLVRYLWLLR